ncbi:hypothetical protein FBU59_000606 [Linderina macrospora]|uniref:Uncharacterized protein n=1 Tax=Linderina macrospora TaxID=4868 RepID=A0ACC1JGR2_9FUNG|nr:hypothetical protein FBU59_000606 [Linderina macrospora]
MLNLLDRVPFLGQIRHSPHTIWAMASIFLFIDTFIYALTVANLPDILQDTLHVSESSNGVVTAMFGIGAVFGGPIAGVLSDRLYFRWKLQLTAAFTYTTAGVVFYISKHYYQLLIFRFINGVASGIACTMLYSAVGDVYPADLLGFKVSIVYFANNIAYTIGPVVGQRLFDLNGIHGTSSIVIAFGIFEVFVLTLFIKDSLVLRDKLDLVQPPATALQDSSSSTCDASSRKDYPTTDEINGGVCLSPAGYSEVNSTTKAIQHKGQVIESEQPDIPLWRLVLRLPVLVATITIIASIGVQCTLEGMVPLHLDDKFGKSDSSMVFVIFGLALTILVPCVGSLSNWLIEKWGESMRYYVMFAGAIGTIFTMLIMALANTYAAMMVGYVLFAFTNLCMFIPSQSAFGDFVNYTKVDSMAQSYALSTLAWAIGAIALPPIGTALYSDYGFTKPLIGISTTICMLCAGSCLIFPIRERMRAKRQ